MYIVQIYSIIFIYIHTYIYKRNKSAYNMF